MKGERVAQLNLLLHSHPEGLRRAEIARRLGVHRSTISRYIDKLKEYIDIYEENNLIKIRSSEKDENISLSLYESLAFNLSAEILSSNTDFQNPHLASGLRKIAMNMRSYAPKISDNILTLAESIDQEMHKKKEASGKFNAILEVLIDSWVSGKMVHLQHKKDSEVLETEFAPYFIGFREEEGGRNPISVTGRLRHTSEITTIDIKSILSAVILDQTYTIPDNLKPFQKRDSSQSYDSIDFVPLVLKVKEKSAINSFRTLNHTPIRYEKNENGETFCYMEAENSIELILRLIQCIDSVEIIKPLSFRKQFVAMLEKILAIYSN
ncbi:MAG: WYL domain-containing protein [Candidatus Cloacimonetes bacterium]|nr:WYL domain-containing protein [Candidatus Cloacimonadota bacterium]